MSGGQSPGKTETLSMTLKQARSIADTSVRASISDPDLAVAIYTILARGAGVGTRDAARLPALRFEAAERTRRAAQAAA